MEKKEYIHTILRYMEVNADGKVIIHPNNLDKPLQDELMLLGIPESDIVLTAERALEVV